MSTMECVNRPVSASVVEIRGDAGEFAEGGKLKRLSVQQHTRPIDPQLPEANGCSRLAASNSLGAAR